MDPAFQRCHLRTFRSVTPTFNCTETENSPIKELSRRSHSFPRSDGGQWQTQYRQWLSNFEKTNNNESLMQIRKYHNKSSKSQNYLNQIKNKDEEDQDDEQQNEQNKKPTSTYKIYKSVEKYQLEAARPRKNLDDYKKYNVMNDAEIRRGDPTGHLQPKNIKPFGCSDPYYYQLSDKTNISPPPKINSPAAEEIQQELSPKSSTGSGTSEWKSQITQYRGYATTSKSYQPLISHGSTQKLFESNYTRLKDQKPILKPFQLNADKLTKLTKTKSLDSIVNIVMHNQRNNVGINKPFKLINVVSNEKISFVKKPSSVQFQDQKRPPQIDSIMSKYIKTEPKTKPVPTLLQRILLKSEAEKKMTATVVSDKEICSITSKNSNINEDTSLSKTKSRDLEVNQKQDNNKKPVGKSWSSKPKINMDECKFTNDKVHTIKKTKNIKHEEPKLTNKYKPRAFDLKDNKDSMNNSDFLKISNKSFIKRKSIDKESNQYKHTSTNIPKSTSKLSKETLVNKIKVKPKKRSEAKERIIYNVRPSTYKTNESKLADGKQKIKEEDLIGTNEEPATLVAEIVPMEEEGRLPPLAVVEVCDVSDSPDMVEQHNLVDETTKLLTSPDNPEFANIVTIDDVQKRYLATPSPRKLKREGQLLFSRRDFSTNSIPNSEEFFKTSRHEVSMKKRLVKPKTMQARLFGERDDIKFKELYNEDTRIPEEFIEKSLIDSQPTAISLLKRLEQLEKTIEFTKLKKPLPKRIVKCKSPCVPFHDYMLPPEELTKVAARLKMLDPNNNNDMKKSTTSISSILKNSVNRPSGDWSGEKRDGTPLKKVRFSDVINVLPESKTVNKVEITPTWNDGDYKRPLQNSENKNVSPCERLGKKKGKEDTKKVIEVWMKQKQKPEIISKIPVSINSDPKKCKTSNIKKVERSRPNTTGRMTETKLTANHLKPGEIAKSKTCQDVRITSPKLSEKPKSNKNRSISKSKKPLPERFSPRTCCTLTAKHSNFAPKASPGLSMGMLMHPPLSIKKSGGQSSSLVSTRQFSSGLIQTSGPGSKKKHDVVSKPPSRSKETFIANTNKENTWHSRKFSRLAKKPLVKLEAPLKSFRDSLPPDLAEELSLCPLDIERFQSMQPIYQRPVAIPSTVSSFISQVGKIDYTKEEKCVKAKLKIKPGNTITCDEKPVKRYTIKDLEKKSKNHCTEQTRLLGTTTNIDINPKEDPNKVPIRKYHVLSKHLERKLTEKNYCNKNLDIKHNVRDEFTTVENLRNIQWRINNFYKWHQLNNTSNIQITLKRFYSCMNFNSSSFLTPIVNKPNCKSISQEKRSSEYLTQSDLISACKNAINSEKFKSKSSKHCSFLPDIKTSGPINYLKTKKKYHSEKGAGEIPPSEKQEELFPNYSKKRRRKKTPINNIELEPLEEGRREMFIPGKKKSDLDETSEYSVDEATSKCSNSSTEPGSIWNRLTNYFKARPNCPSPEECRRRVAREKAEKYAKLAGLVVCEKDKLRKDVIVNEDLPKVITYSRKKRNTEDYNMSDHQKRSYSTCSNKHSLKLPCKISGKHIHGTNIVLVSPSMEKIIQNSIYQRSRPNSPKKNLNVQNRCYCTSVKKRFVADDDDDEQLDATENDFVSLDSVSTYSRAEAFEKAVGISKTKRPSNENDDNDEHISPPDTDKFFKSSIRKKPNNKNINLISKRCYSKEGMEAHLREINRPLEEKDKIRLAERILKSFMGAAAKYGQDYSETDSNNQNEGGQRVPLKLYPRKMLALSEMMFNEPKDELGKYRQAQSLSVFLDIFRKTEVLSDVNYEDLEKMKTNKLVNELNKLLIEENKKQGK